MDWKTLLFSFEGRVGRGAYWGLVLASIVLFGGLTAWSFYSLLSSPDPSQGGGLASILTLVLGLAFIWPALAIQAKRWHDVDKSGWWILINLVPAVGGLIALVFNGFLPGTEGPNRFGAATK